MRNLALVATLGVAAIAGCATSGGDPAQAAARKCGYFAQEQGTRLLGVDGVDPATDATANYQVRLRIEDALGRRTNMACLYSSADNKARWATPLPNGFIKL